MDQRHIVRQKVLRKRRGTGDECLDSLGRETAETLEVLRLLSEKVGGLVLANDRRFCFVPREGLDIALKPVHSRHVPEGNEVAKESDPVAVVDPKRAEGALQLLHVAFGGHAILDRFVWSKRRQLVEELGRREDSFVPVEIFLVQLRSSVVRAKIF